MDLLQDLVRLHRMGTGDREVAQLLKMSPNTKQALTRAVEAQLAQGVAQFATALAERCAPSFNRPPYRRSGTDDPHPAKAEAGRGGNGS
jgi:hypothetical protein